jgi:putative aminopeptidase FrvX
VLSGFFTIRSSGRPSYFGCRAATQTALATPGRRHATFSMSVELIHSPPETITLDGYAASHRAVRES